MPRMQYPHETNDINIPMKYPHYIYIYIICFPMMHPLLKYPMILIIYIYMYKKNWWFYIPLVTQEDLVSSSGRQ